MKWVYLFCFIYYLIVFLLLRYTYDPRKDAFIKLKVWHILLMIVCFITPFLNVIAAIIFFAFGPPFIWFESNRIIKARNATKFDKITSDKIRKISDFLNKEIL